MKLEFVEEQSCDRYTIFTMESDYVPHIGETVVLTYGDSKLTYKVVNVISKFDQEVKVREDLIKVILKHNYYE